MARVLQEKIVSCCLAILIASAVHGSVFNSDQIHSLETFVNSLIECRNIPGLTLAVVRGNETFTRGFGVVNMTSGRNVTSSSLFGIGSLTKAFTTSLLAMLLNETGSYTWVTPLVKILGDDFRLGDEYMTQHVTLKDLLTHRTGTVNFNLPAFAGEPKNLTRAEFTKLLPFMPMKGEFRDKFDYNNYMYALAGHVAEVLGNASWEDLVLKRIFQPLGMNDSRILGKTVNVDADNFAQPYVQVGEEIVESDPSIYSISPQEPAGAIASTADDMARWLMLHLHKGQIKQDQVQLLNETWLQEIYTPYMALPPGFDWLNSIRKPIFPVTWSSIGYGYGWTTSMYQGYKIIWHSGGIFAYITIIGFFPDLNLGIFVSTNGPGNDGPTLVISQILFFIADLVLGETPWQQGINTCNFPQPWVNATSPPPRENNIVPGGFPEPENFVGKYGNRIFGDMEIVRNGTDGLWASYNRLVGKLHRTTADHVTLMEVMGSFRFLSAGINTTIYFNLTFTEQSQDGRYHVMLMSAADFIEEGVLEYRRGIHPTNLPAPAPAPDHQTNGKTKAAMSVIAPIVTILSLWLR